LRFFEWMTIVFLFLTWFSRLLPASRRFPWRLLLPVFALLAVLAQFLVEHYRWQMLPAYGLVVLSCLFEGVAYRRRPSDTPPARSRSGVFRILAGIVLSFLGLAVVAALPVLLPVPRLPEPTGPHAVGVTLFEWVDESRSESYSPDPDDHRDLLVQVWYPSDDVAGAARLSPWGAIREPGPAHSRFLGFALPGFFFEHLALVKTHSYWDAPLSPAQATYPVLVFSHGYGVTLDQNLVQMEELASHGYVVFSIAHPYDSLEVIYPDGRRVAMRPEIWDPPDPAASQAVKALWSQFMAETDPVKKEALLNDYYVRSGDRETLALWVADTRFVMDKVEQLQRGEIPGALAGRLNLEQLGVFGHSFGGITAGETCSFDDRCKAAVNLDGPQFGHLQKHPLTQPFMVMYSQDYVGCCDFIYDRGQNPRYRVFVAGSLHMHYTDLAYFSPAFFRSAGPARMEAIINRYLLAFFDQYLKGLDTPLLDPALHEYPGVDYQIR